MLRDTEIIGGSEVKPHLEQLSAHQQELLIKHVPEGALGITRMEGHDFVIKHRDSETSKAQERKYSLQAIDSDGELGKPKSVAEHKLVDTVIAAEAGIEFDRAAPRIIQTLEKFKLQSRAGLLNYEEFETYVQSSLQDDLDRDSQTYTDKYKKNLDRDATRNKFQELKEMADVLVGEVYELHYAQAA